jgi:glucose-6-phosphate 1-dehydrogenase
MPVYPGALVNPVLGAATPVCEYDPNTWGPVEADRIIAGDGGWRNPKPVADKALEMTK